MGAGASSTTSCAPATGPVPFAPFDLASAESIVDGIPLDRRIILLGESTHGTEEFYRTRVAITKRLIEERGFTAVVFEGDWPFFETIAKYAKGKTQNPSPYPKDEIFPPWMWRNQCMKEFFDWCKLRREDQTPELFGMDCYALFESKRLLLNFLEKHDPEFHKEVSGRLAFIDKFTDAHAYGDAVVNGNLGRIAHHVQDTLTTIQSRLQWNSDKYQCSPLERLNAEQNCEVVIAADEYYRKCVSEPPGSQASWNSRDQHMTTTLLRIQAHLNDPKVIVWAHNSHVGDSTATTRGGDSFAKNETWNLGQMVRATFGHHKTWIVGQYTYDGAVTAAKRWGGEHKDRKLNPALPESYEGALHREVQPHVGDGVPFYFATAPFADPTGKEESQEGAAGGTFSAARAGVRAALEQNDRIAKAMVDLLQPAVPRLQRWVGVSYKPDTERQSHYGSLVLSQCYDQVIFVNSTHGLQPIVKVKKLPDPPNLGAQSESATVVNTRSSNKRLLKEYRRLEKSKPPGIQARPSETSMLNWHFLLSMDKPPYTGGCYHGLLTFPPEYPMRPPAFQMLTPSGRFETNSRLCLSMSDYHPESWNPSWSVETLLVGLQSFMYEESNAIGSISASASTRHTLAKQSHEFNLKNAQFVELFGDYDYEAAIAACASGQVEEENGAQESVCRFCFSSEGELISPCMCRGSNEWVHLECLRQWQKNVLLTQSTHPKYQTSIDRICNVCLEPFTGKGIPLSRHEQIMSYLGGDDIARMVRPGNLLVSTRDSSRENLELIAQHPEITARLMTWTKAVFLMISKSRTGGLLAVSCSQPVDSPPADCRISSGERREWSQREKTVAKLSWSIQHYDGGPMERTDPMCVAHVKPEAECEHQNGVLFVPPHFIYGQYENVERVLKKYALADGSQTTKIHVIWGCGGWGGTQVLAEIARGGWGLVEIKDYVSTRPDPSMPTDFELDFDWSRMISMAKCAPKSEYTRGKKS